MSDTFSKVEVITGVVRGRHFSTDLKLAAVAETMQPGMSVSYVARLHRLSTQPSVPLAAVDVRRRRRRSAPMMKWWRRPQSILKEALDPARAKTELAVALAAPANPGED